MKSKSSTVTKQPQSATLPLITPGEFLSEEFLKPLGLSMNRLALALRIPVTRVQGIVNGNREITADTALRLARYFGTSAEYWIDLQSTYELKRARRDSLARIQAEVRKPVGAAQPPPPAGAAASDPKFTESKRNEPSNGA